MKMKPVPTEREIREYFQYTYRLPDDKPIIYPTREKESDRVKLK